MYMYNVKAKFVYAENDLVSLYEGEIQSTCL